MKIKPLSDENKKPLSNENYKHLYEMKIKPLSDEKSKTLHATPFQLSAPQLISGFHYFHGKEWK